MKLLLSILALASMLAVISLTGCVVNREYARTQSTATNGVVTTTEARTWTMAAGDAKGAIEKVRASAGKTSSVGVTGIDMEPSASTTIGAAGPLIGDAVRTFMGAPPAVK